MPSDTGFPRADAEADFLKVRRQQRVSGLARKVRGEQRRVLSLDEVLQAVGNRGEEALGVQSIPLDKIVGSVDKVREFDPSFRPTSGRNRARWERLAEAVRRGQPIPPIDVYQVGDLYFVRDGHHRVSVMKALGDTAIEADVTRIRTTLDASGIRGREDLRGKNLRRLFLERVPLDRLARGEVRCAEPQHYPELAEMVEAWSARLMFREGVLLTASHAAARWYAEEFTMVMDLARDGGFVEPGEDEGDAYVRLAGTRYHLMGAHVWSEEVFEEIARSRRKAPKR
ncbi:ParB-like nuclease family protein [Knoellia remsis]|uniref:ParB-like nuclease family protein n=1 Tax=Knoellia remsis TaxID=407159 RepID=A0A2T0UXK8_9MICO|nr:ParB N-terminal domain-containing protein [Knoellia remsis]PRY62578.1 ParB-like nuclease family protein [Knoellia remsis]